MWHCVVMGYADAFNLDSRKTCYLVKREAPTLCHLKGDRPSRGLQYLNNLIVVHPFSINSIYTQYFVSNLEMNRFFFTSPN